MSNLRTLTALIGLVATFAFAGAESQCTSCLNQAAEMRQNLTGRDINDWLKDTTAYCNNLESGEDKESCKKMVQSNGKQLLILVRDDPLEFCRWLGRCKVDLGGVPQLAMAVQRALHPHMSEPELKCLECTQSALKLKYALNENVAHLFPRIVESKSNECIQSSENPSEVSACLAEVAKLSYAFSYLMMHDTHDFCTWTGVCENKHPVHDVAKVWQEIERAKSNSTRMAARARLARGLESRIGSRIGAD